MRDQKELSPVQLHQGAYEQCRDVQPMWREAGWITGPYREGCEPKALQVIQSNHLLDKRRHITHNDPHDEHPERRHRAAGLAPANELLPGRRSQRGTTGQRGDRREPGPDPQDPCPRDADHGEQDRQRQAVILDKATCTAAAGVAVQDRLYGQAEWAGNPGRWAERSAEWQLAYRTVYCDGPSALGVSMISQPGDVTMTSTIGQREATNRAIKATAILAVLDQHSMSADDVERLDDAGWQAAAQLAAKRQSPPAGWTDASEVTRGTVIGTLRQREATPDLFTGFSS